MIYGKHIVSLCIPRIHEETNHTFIAALGKALAAWGARLLVYSTPSELYWNSIDEQGEKTVFDLINYDITDVVVIQDEAIKNKDVIKSVIASSQAHNIPVITLSELYDGCFNIRFDYSAGFYKMVQHVLRDHNVKDFHFIAGIRNNPFSDERINVVRRAAAELDIPFGDDDISYGEFWSVPTEKAVEALFTRRRRLPQAIICANDSMAITTINVLKRHGIRVPENVIVTGFDGIKEIKYCIPRVTTCLCSSEQLAGTVAKTAQALVRGEKPDTTITVIPELHRSESCGCHTEEPLNASEELTYVNNSFYRFELEEESMFRMISRILECHSMQEISGVLDKYHFYDMVVALNPECSDRRTDPLTRVREEPFGDTVDVIYNTNKPLHGQILRMKTTDLHPDMEEILTEHSEPVIIFSLNYMSVPMGFIAYNFHNYDIQNYYKASQTLNTLNAALGGFRSMQYQHYLSEKIEEMYRRDGLTQLLNRAALKNGYRPLLERSNGVLTVVLADLDGLKTINDSYGHDDGDFAICTVARALQESCPAEAMCVRWGGDEMVAVIPGEVSDSVIHGNIARYLADVNQSSGKPYSISASVGVKTFNVTPDAAFEDMVRATDQLMYDEKNRKKMLRAQGIGRTDRA